MLPKNFAVSHFFLRSFPLSFQVITWQERATQEPCCCSEPPLARTQSPTPTPSNPKLNRENPHHSITRGRRRSGSDNAKLSPLETCGSADGKSRSFNAATRGSGPVGNSGFGGESVGSGNQGSARAAARVEDEGNDGRKGSASSVRQLDSIVDEARAEVCTLLNDMHADTVQVVGMYATREVRVRSLGHMVPGRTSMYTHPARYVHPYIRLICHTR